MSKKKAKKKVKKTCGDYGGRRSDGKPCTRPAGWGRKRATRGCCMSHTRSADAKMQSLKKRFLTEYRKGTVSMSAAARKVGHDHSTIWRWRQADHEFNQHVLDAQKEVDAIRADMVEDSLFKRVVEGSASPAETIFWLKNRASHRWKERVHHSIDIEGEVRRYAEEQGIDPEKAVDQAKEIIWGEGSV